MFDNLFVSCYYQAQYAGTKLYHTLSYPIILLIQYNIRNVILIVL